MVGCDRLKRNGWRFGIVVAAVGAMLFIEIAPAWAAVPESYRQAWNDVRQRIDEGIERNRKGDAVVEVVDADGQPVQEASLEIQQKTHEFLFGCNAFVLGQLGDKNEKYEKAFVQLFNFATVPFYWAGTEPKQGELRYQEGGSDIWRRPPPDRFLPFAKKYGITLKGHPLHWHGHNPAWLPKDPVELKKLYQKRFREIAERYGKDIPIWDVVNESLVCPKNNPLFTPDREYVAWVFNEVNPLFPPEDLLMINELTPFNDAGVGEKNAYYRQVKQLLGQGVNIEGIGFQFHFFSEGELKPHLAGKAFPPGRLLDVYESFADLDRPLFITEVTVPSTGEDGESVQAEVITNLYRLWFGLPRMEGITYWNLADGTAMVGEDTCKGGILDADLNPKAAGRVIDKLINQDWKTNLATKTDAVGKALFRGFYGKYTVKVTAGNVTKEFEIDLSKDGQVQHKLTLKP